MPNSARSRYYSSPPTPHSLAANYYWSDTAVITGAGGAPLTGAWIPATVAADGSINVNIQGATFSGEINVDFPPIGAFTGINNGGMSGYAPQSGMLQTNGVAVVTSGFNPQYQSGQKAPFAIDNINGGELVVLSDLDASVDSITTFPATATTASNYVPSGFAGGVVIAGTALIANPNRIAWGIQVIGSGSPLYVKLGVGPCGTGSFNLLLRAASSDFGADGGTFLDTPAMYRGDVSVSGGTRFTCWEM